MPYRVVRYYFRDDEWFNLDSEVLESGLSLADAQAHCRNPETSSSTATSPEATARTEQCGPWFDGYERE